MSDPSTPPDAQRPTTPEFELRSLRRVDPTPSSALICICGVLDADASTEPFLYVKGAPRPKVLRPLWSSRDGDVWTAEFAVASSRLDEDFEGLFLVLPDPHPLVALPPPDVASAGEAAPETGSEDEPEAPPEAHAAPDTAQALTLGPWWKRRPKRRLTGMATVAALCVASYAGSSALQGSAEEPMPAGAPSGPASPVQADVAQPKRTKSAPEQAVAATPRGMSLAAHATSRRVGLYRSATATRARTFLRNPNTMGAPAVFLVKSASGDRFKVALPIRPNGATAWIRASDVRVKLVDYSVKIDLAHHRLTVSHGGRVVTRSPVGVGKSLTPTPSGVYFITALLKPRNPDGVYGPYAFGLSAHSTVLDEFAGGNGRVGIHGTNRPSGIGADVSHGCIRVPNDVIRHLAKRLPLGTPVRITR